MRYHLVIDGQQCGPFEFADVSEKLSAGEINQETLYWKEGMPQWAPLAALFQVGAAEETMAGSTLNEASGLGEASEARASDSRHSRTLDPSSSDAERDRRERESAGVRNAQENVKRFRALPFILVVFCCFLPFARISCSMQQSAGVEFPSVQLVTGTEVRIVDEIQKVRASPTVVLTFLCPLAGQDPERAASSP